MKKTLIYFIDDIEAEASLLERALKDEIENYLREKNLYEVKKTVIDKGTFDCDMFSSALIDKIPDWKNQYEKVKILVDLCLVEKVFVNNPSGVRLAEAIDNKAFDYADYLYIYMVTNKVLGGSDYDTSIDTMLKSKLKNVKYMGILEKPIYYDNDGPHLTGKLTSTTRYIDIIPEEYRQRKDYLAFIYAILKGEKK
ncbi:MAG: hypothetical protein J6U54_00080 [Clostridiales bacterium]|nr:hypothetical protein [Clostridiales bacterium]